MTSDTNISPEARARLQARQVFDPDELYLDDTGASYASDGSERLPVDEHVVRSVLHWHRRTNAGDIYGYAERVKLGLLPGPDPEHPLVVPLNGRQRRKAAQFLNAVFARVLQVWEASGRDRARCGAALVQAAAAGRAGDERYRDLAWLQEEDVSAIVGGRVSGERVQGLLAEDGPGGEARLPRVLLLCDWDWADIDPEDPEALRAAMFSRVTTRHPPSVVAAKCRRLLDAGYSEESVAATVPCSPKSLGDVLLVLDLVPEVQAARDAGKVTHAQLKETFFSLSRGDSGRRVPISEEEQRARLLELLTGERPPRVKLSLGLPAVGAPAAPSSAESVDREASAGTPEETQPTLSIEEAPDGQERTGAQPVAAAPRVLPGATRGHQGYSGAQALARVLDAIRSRRASLPTPDDVDPDEDARGEEWLRRKVSAARVQGAEAAVAFLSGDEAALEQLPELADALREALAAAVSAQEGVVEGVREKPRREAKPRASGRLTPAQHLAQRALDLLADWESVSEDERTEWPESPAEDQELARLLLSAREAYDEACSADGKEDLPEIFIREYVLEHVLSVAT